MSPGVISCVAELIARIGERAKTGDEFEIGDMYQALTLDVICRTAMGIQYNIQQTPNHRFLNSSRMLFGSSFPILAVLLGEQRDKLKTSKTGDPQLNWGQMVANTFG